MAESMRPIFIILIIALVVLQHKLWLGDGNLIEWVALDKKLKSHEQENTKLALRNQALEADIKELKSGEQALEEQARYELGMIKEDEVFYQFVN
jgi:cell division protein FtsB